MKFLPKAQVLTLEELTSIAEAFIQLGVEKIRITGGEPLIRNNIIELFERLGQHPKLRELTLTTNGTHLSKYARALANAGVSKINVSLDSIDSQEFTTMTRFGDLNAVLDGIAHAQACGIRVKINTVLLKSINLSSIKRLLDFVIEQQLDISFIEEMPLGDISHHERGDELIHSEQLAQIINQDFELHPISTPATAGPARVFRLANHQSTVGFISPMSNNFCSSCNRVRVTPQGKLLLCLGQENSVDLRKILRANPGNSEKLTEAIEQAIALKPKQHEFNHSEPVQILRFMNSTGG